MGKIIQSPYFGKVNYMTQLLDKGYAIAGTSEYSYYVMKLDAQGNELWAKNYSFNGNPLLIDCIKPTDDGGFLLSGPSNFPPIGMFIIKVNNTGNVVWNKFYNKQASFNTAYLVPDIIQKGNDIYFTVALNQITDPNASVPNNSGVVMKMDYSNGNTIWTKNYTQNGQGIYFQDIHWYGNNLLVNALGSFLYLDTPKNIYCKLDISGTLLSSHAIYIPVNYPAVTQAFPQKNGDIYFLSVGGMPTLIPPFGGSVSNFIKIDSNNNVKWAKGYAARQSLQYGAIGKNETFAALGTGYGEGVPLFSSLANKYVFQKIDSAGNIPGPICDVYPFSLSVKPIPVNRLPFSWDTDSSITVTVQDTFYNTSSPYADIRYVCPKEFVDSCSFLKLSGYASVCNLNNIYTYRVHRNPACNEPVTWDISSEVTIISKSDSAVRVKFPAFGNYKIAALFPFACTPVKDSIMVTAVSHTAILDLGPDTSLCPGNTIVLHASNLFLSWIWQDGSTDSVFTANKAGVYWVKVTDSCGNIISDTVNIKVASINPLYVGPDRNKCNNDTLHLDAPSGFLNYKWSPDYNIGPGPDTLADIIVNPQVNTSYVLVAEKTPGCFVTDTIRVTVKVSPPIYLGNDTSFCAGQSATLDAGSGFDSYIWNTGSVSQSITASQQGNYSVKAIVDGCTSYDTLTIINVSPLPSFSLGNDTALCQGKLLHYDFNLPQASYQWSTGSTLNDENISLPGTYWLKVTESGCSNSDTINVLYNPSPVVNLGSDTTLCEKQTLLLNVLNINTTYKWQDGSTSPSYLVKSAGAFFVIATMNNCTASDTINIVYKALPFFTLGKDSFLCAGQPYMLKPSINTTADLLWQDGSTASSFTIQKEGIYFLTATNECGSYTDSVTITSGFCNIMMPSGFTPNGDGVNDVFKVKYPFPLKEFHFVMYDRWGEKVFETSDINRGWDGIYKGLPAEQDTYVWIISYLDVNGNRQQLKGSVMLLR